MIVLRNLAHAGDVVLARTVIGKIRAANPKASFQLQCKDSYVYLWEDLGIPIRTADPPKGTPVINLWFAFYGDMLVNGLTYRSSVETYNRQAAPLGLATLPYEKEQQFVKLPRVMLGDVPRPSVLIENGRVLSGQPVLSINEHIYTLADAFRGTIFYLSGPAPESAMRHNVRSVADWDLRKLSSLSEKTSLMVARLSAVMVCSFTEANHGRRRIVFGSPLGCPIWDEVGVTYASDIHSLIHNIREILT